MHGSWCPPKHHDKPPIRMSGFYCPSRSTYDQSTLKISWKTLVLEPQEKWTFIPTLVKLAVYSIRNINLEIWLVYITMITAGRDEPSTGTSSSDLSQFRSAEWGFVWSACPNLSWFWNNWSPSSVHPYCSQTKPSPYFCRLPIHLAPIMGLRIHYSSTL